MKKILLIAMLAVISLTTFAQVSAKILSVETVTKGQVKGDLITYEISSPYKVNGVGFEVVFGGVEINGAGGVYNPNVFSFTTTTATQFVGLRSGYLGKERAYTITVIYDKGFYDPNEPGYVKSEPYTVPGH